MLSLQRASQGTHTAAVSAGRSVLSASPPGRGALKGACAWTPPASACASVLYELAGSASSSSEGGGGLGNPQHTGSDKASSLELPHGVVHVAQN